MSLTMHAYTNTQRIYRFILHDQFNDSIFYLVPLLWIEVDGRSSNENEINEEKKTANGMSKKLPMRFLNFG